MSAADTTPEVTDLLQQLIRNACVNDGTAESGGEGRSADFRRLRESSRPYAGTWVVTHGDTITFPQMGDRFRLVAFTLDSDTVAVAHDCVFRGSLTFAVPKAETLAVTWFGVPERVTVFGWPAEMEPISGFDARWWDGRDSLRGELLFNERVGIQVRPGVTAQFVAGRARPSGRLSSPP